MSKIVFCNNNITGIHYSGYTITKVYACGGEVVYEAQRPVPTNPIARYTPNCNSSDWLEIGDDNGDSAVTKTEVDKYVTPAEYSGMCSLQFYTGCTEVGTGAFSGAGMVNINSWGDITTIGASAFTRCNNLETVYYNCGGCPLVVGQRAFANDGNLSAVTLYASTIGKYAFASCTNLKTVNLTATTVETSAFLYCNSLSSLTLSNIETISDGAFQVCPSLTSITIPSSITSIGGYAFLNCTSLTKIEFKGYTPPTVNSHAFEDTNNCPIVIPAGVSKTTWASASGWSSYATRLKYPYEV